MWGSMAREYLTGTSGWHYNHWIGPFYPPGLPKSHWLDYYSRGFSTVEVNNTFYRLPAEKAFEQWKSQSPEGFTFALKVSRLITHMKKMRNVEAQLQNFISRARLLKSKLGPLLFQTPPSMLRNDELLKAFLSLLPGDLKYAFEFRHVSWHSPEMYDILRRFNAGLCVFDMPGFTTPREVTSDFCYLRFHGPDSLYGSSYSENALRSWADWLHSLPGEVKYCYIYFNNDASAYAVYNAKKLSNLLIS